MTILFDAPKPFTYTTFGASTRARSWAYVAAKLAGRATNVPHPSSNMFITKAFAMIWR